MEIQKSNSEGFLTLLNDFLENIDLSIAGEEKIFSKKDKKAYSGYKAIFKKTKTSSPSYSKIMEGFKHFFANFDYVLFSPNPISCIKTKIFYDNSKTKYYIPLDCLLANLSEDSEVIRDYLLRMSQELEDAADKRESKRQFILSRAIFGIKIDDTTPEGAFLCKWILRSKEIIPINEMMGLKDAQGLLPILMSMLTSNKLNNYTTEIMNDWKNRELNLPAILRKMADITEEMGFGKTLNETANVPEEMVRLPALLRATSEDMERFEDVEKD